MNQRAWVVSQGRCLAVAVGAAALLVIGGTVDAGPSIGLSGSAYAQQTGSPGGSGNQGTSTGPGSTARTSNQNQNRAGGGGGGGGGGGAGGVPTPTGTLPDSNTGGMTTQHNMPTSVTIAPGWCDDVSPDGVVEESRLTGKNLARLDAAIAHVGGAPKSATTADRRALFAAYQRAMETSPRKVEAAAAALGDVTTTAIDKGIVVDVNALLCLGSSADEVTAVVEQSAKHQIRAGK